MRKVKEILTDCILIVPYTAVYLVAYFVAAVIVLWQWIVRIYQKKIKIGGKSVDGIREKQGENK